MKNALEKYNIGKGLKKFFLLGKQKLIINKLSLIMSLATVVAVSGGRAANPYSDGGGALIEYRNYWEAIRITQEVGSFKDALDFFESSYQSPSQALSFSFFTQPIERLGSVKINFKSGLCILNQLKEALQSVADSENKTIQLDLSFEKFNELALEKVRPQLKTVARKSALIIVEMDKKNKNANVVYDKDISDCAFTISEQ